MDMLFLTTFNVSIEKEHFFTIDIWKELSKISNAKLASILFSNKIVEPTITVEKRNEKKYYLLTLPTEHIRDEKYIIKNVQLFFHYIKPDIIHSNMIEGYDIIAAKRLNIPIVLTIHIGGFICPRGGGNGFLMYNDSICNQKIGKECMKCGCMDLPVPHLSYFLLKAIPKQFITYIANKIKNRNIFYITPLLSKYTHIQNRKQYIQLLNYAHIIAANEQLVHLLKINGIPNSNIHLIPHGVKERQRLPLPDYNGKIKFFYLGRVQYSKGLHILMKAFEGIDINKYELHIIGDAEKAGHGFEYQRKIENLSKKLNVTFHGRIPNAEIEKIIRNCHIMVHPTICLEVYGISISESLSMGRPVLATRCGGAEMQIKEGINGWLVNSNSVNMLHEKIVSLISNHNIIYETANQTQLPMDIHTYVNELSEVYTNIFL